VTKLLLVHSILLLVISTKAMSLTKIPKIIAFDLDGTIWSPEMYELWGGGAPFSVEEGNILRDRSGTKCRLLGSTADILDECTQAPFADSIVCWVSCTDEPSWAAECAKKFTTSSGQPLSEVANRKYNKIFKVSHYFCSFCSR